MAKKYDVIIVGGGIFGCAVAYYLCRQSTMKVALVERGMIGAQTTSLAASVVTRGKATFAQIDLVLETHCAIDALETGLGMSLDFNHVGSLHIAQSEQSARDYAAQAARLKEIGDAPKEVSLARAKRFAPWLTLDRAELIIHNARDGFIDPYRLASAYLQGAQAHGGLDVLSSTEVLGLNVDGRRVRGIETDGGYLEAEQIVVAAGPWANHLLRPAGSAAAIAPVRSHYWITGPDHRYPVHSPVVILPEANAYARPEVGGLLFGLRHEPNQWLHPEALPKTLHGLSFDEDYQGWDALAEAVGPLLALCPSLAEVDIQNYISGPSGYTPDGKHIIGPAPNLDGVYLAAGCCGSGLTISGGVGRAIAELVQGKASTVDLTDFAPDRFGAFDPYDQAFIETCAQSRFRKKAG